MENNQNKVIPGEEMGGVMGLYIIKLDTTLCSGCRACIPRCPKGIFQVVNDTIYIGANAKECNGCNKCKSACDTDAIDITYPLS